MSLDREKLEDIAKSMFAISEDFDHDDTNYVFDVIKEYYYALRLKKRFDGIIELMEKTPFNKKNRVMFRDNDFQFWQEKVCSDNEKIFERNVLVFYDADICRNDRYLVVDVIRCKKGFEMFDNKVIAHFATEQSFKKEKRNRFSGEARVLSDGFALKYEQTRNQVGTVEKPHFDEKNLNDVVWWLDCAISYIRNGDH